VRFLDLDAPTRARIESFVAERLGAEEARAPQPSPRKGSSVLVVDDDPTYQQMIAAAFKSDDVVRFATNGFEALALCGREVPNVIVSDVNMPKMDGWQLLRLLRTKPQYAEIPVLFTTTLKSEADRLRGYQLGVDDYIAKPFRVAELRARVERLLSRASASRSGPAVAPAPARSLHGDLAHVSLASVLGLLELERRTGRLTVKADTVGILSVREGLLVDAVIAEGDARGRDALFAMLAWHHGDFEFLVCDVRGDAAAGVSISRLLLEHAQFSDESGG
jgi:DNA-binding response OmpR family regulator